MTSMMNRSNSGSQIRVVEVDGNNISVFQSLESFDRMHSNTLDEGSDSDTDVEILEPFYETAQSVKVGLSISSGNAKCNRDYISNNYIRGITLDELEKSISSNEENVIYIGREDCVECASFEKRYEKILKKYSVESNGYYTNLDRNSDNANRMYKIIEKYGITEVPALGAFKSNKLIKRFDIENNKEIESYYKENF